MALHMCGNTCKGIVTREMMMLMLPVILTLKLAWVSTDYFG